MNSTLKLSLVMLVSFASALALNFAFGWFAPDDVRASLAGWQARPVRAGAIMVGLLAVDSVLAVPTLATLVVGGHLLGPFWGALCGWIGMNAAGAICYYGARFGARMFASDEALESVRRDVGAAGPVPLLFARAVPVLPETLSAMAGLGGLPARRFFLYFGLGNIPFAVVGAWSGSVSSWGNPWPALIASVGLTGLAALGLRWFRRRRATGPRES